MTTAVSTRPSSSALAVRRGRRDRAMDHVWIVGFAVAVGLIVTVGMWLRHGAIGATSAPGGVASELGQLTALVGTYAVLVQLLLMSRIAWLEYGIGLDRLAIVHRWLGFATVWLLTAHVMFTTIGWANLEGVSIVKETHDLIFHQPDILIAWVGFAFLVCVAVTSVRA